MDWIALIDMLGGGLNAVVIVALAVAWWIERRRVDQLQDARFNDFREMMQVTADGSRTMEEAIRALERAAGDRR
ncbi:hypothetical protein [Mameliella sediminis]|uniref:hypothetical protein n=1 Tax=Mameliella sediminis TaxID=2836866 RepID=UPI001C471E92|nr:hypothetical protein [Mameliella sediminis]MBV7394546.1 hypothetical protein [Mameliella sediminis]